MCYSSIGWQQKKVRLTSLACCFPSYNTRRTLTFSCFLVSVLILPKPFCSGIAGAAAALLWTGARRGLLAAAAAVKSERDEGREDEDAKRLIERMSNTILNYLFNPASFFI
jgi:hypothetical protein